MDYLQLGFGFFAGFLIGFVIRAARVRRQTEPLKLENARLKAELAEVRTTPGPQEVPARPQRWTGTEIAAVLGAIGTIIATAGGLWTNSQRTSLKEYQDKVTRLEKEQESRTAALRDVLTEFDLTQWSAISKKARIVAPSGRTAPQGQYVVDGRNIGGVCNDSRVTLAYNGSNPSFLHCKGRVVVALAAPTRIAFMPD